MKVSDRMRAQDLDELIQHAEGQKRALDARLRELKRQRAALVKR